MRKYDIIALIIRMAQIIIRRLEEGVVRKLRAKAAADGISAEEEARRILRGLLMAEEPRMSSIDYLRTMPDIEDDLLERPKSRQRKVEL